MGLWWWLRVMDALAACGFFGSPLYLWAIGRASACVDWEPIDTSEGGEPW